LVYRHHGHVINLFIWPAMEAGSTIMVQGGYNLVHWTQGDLNLWAVSDLDADKLKQFRQALAVAAPH
ncbi:MAG TPA: anti-sigma factor, partial [Alphaproteobacteria bacterium]|nr:anti-sigma factor [Alphaproteobacteria bacterium]